MTVGFNNINIGHRCPPPSRITLFMSCMHCCNAQWKRSDLNLSSAKFHKKWEANSETHKLGDILSQGRDSLLDLHEFLIKIIITLISILSIEFNPNLQPIYFAFHELCHIMLYWKEKKRLKWTKVNRGLHPRLIRMNMAICGLP